MSDIDDADRVFVRGLRVEGVIGVHAWEREVRQELVLDLEMSSDNRAVAANDDLGAALNYQAVAKRASRIVADSQFELLESLAETLATLLLEEFALSWLRLRLSKPGALPGSTVVGVQIERSAGSQNKK